MSNTQSAKLLSALEKGEQLTSKQISARFKIANPTAVICNLRSARHLILTTYVKNNKGEKVAKYSVAKRIKNLKAKS